MMQQGNGGITGPSSAPPGGSVTVKVTSGHTSVLVTGGGKSSTYPVVNGTATVQVPPDVQPGSSFWVIAGTGKETCFIRIEVIEE